MQVTRPTQAHHAACVEEEARAFGVPSVGAERCVPPAMTCTIDIRNVDIIKDK